MHGEAAHNGTSSIRYTVIGGGGERASETPVAVSAVILGRKERLFRLDLIENLLRAGFPSILYMTGSIEPGMAEAKTKTFQGLKFVLFAEETSPGTMVNCAMRESAGNHVLVLWSDMILRGAGFSSRFFERLADSGLLCAAPRIFDTSGNELPQAALPAFDRKELSPVAVIPGRVEIPTLYPVGFTGFFLRAAFLATGGYDSEFHSPYWECLDFGFRAWLQGERLSILPSLELVCGSGPPDENRGGREDFARFWLKNMAPVYKGDSAILPVGSLWGFLMRRGGNPLRAFRSFRVLAAWIKENTFRFATDSRGLVEMWGESVDT